MTDETNKLAKRCAQMNGLSDEDSVEDEYADDDDGDEK